MHSVISNQSIRYNINWYPNYALTDYQTFGWTRVQRRWMCTTEIGITNVNKPCFWPVLSVLPHKITIKFKFIHQSNQNSQARSNQSSASTRLTNFWIIIIIIIIIGNNNLLHHHWIVFPIICVTAFHLYLLSVSELAIVPILSEKSLTIDRMWLLEFIKCWLFWKMLSNGR